MDNQLIMKMTSYYGGQPHRIQHFMKVYAYARMIGEQEQIDSRSQRILEVAAIVHDVGIKVSEEKYGDSTGTHQQLEGPSVARKMLGELGYKPEIIERVCYLVAHHHTYKEIDGLDYQILVEADFLVNLFENENGINETAVRNTLNTIFVTKSGTAILKAMFLSE